jgi:hypothetical protein
VMVATDKGCEWGGGRGDWMCDGLRRLGHGYGLGHLDVYSRVLSLRSCGGPRALVIPGCIYI